MCVCVCAQSDMFKSPNKVLVHAVVFVDLVISFRCLNRNGKNKNNKNKNKKERKKERRKKKHRPDTFTRVYIEIYTSIAAENDFVASATAGSIKAKS